MVLSMNALWVAIFLVLFGIVAVTVRLAVWVRARRVGRPQQRVLTVVPAAAVVDISPEMERKLLVDRLKRLARERAGQLGFLTDDVEDISAEPPGAVLYPVQWVVEEDVVPTLLALVHEFGRDRVWAKLGWLVDFGYDDSGRSEVRDGRTLHRKTITIELSAPSDLHSELPYEAFARWVLG